MKLVNLKDDLHLSLKKMALDRGVTLQDLVNELLEKLVKKEVSK